MRYFYLTNFLFSLTFLFYSPLLGFSSFDEEDQRGNYAASHYTSRLENGTGLTTEIIEEWLKKTSIFNEVEKENISASIPKIQDGTQSEQVFFVKSKTQEWVIKVWAPGLFNSEHTENKARNTHAVKTAEYLSLFNNDVNYLSLTADIWGGFYVDKMGNRHYLHLMPKAQGIQLNEYLTELDNEKRLLLTKRIGEVFGKAHAYKNTLKDEDNISFQKPWALFVHGDPKPANTFIDFSSSPPKITLIDLDGVGVNLREQPMWQGKYSPSSDIGTLLTHYTGAARNLAWEEDTHKINRISAFITSYSEKFGKLKNAISRALFVICGKDIYEGYNQYLPYQKFITDSTPPSASYVRLLSSEKVVESLKNLAKKLELEDEFVSLHNQMQQN